MNTATVIVGGLIIAMVALSIGYATLMSFNQNPPLEAPVTVFESTFILDCTKTTGTLGDLVFEAVESASLQLLLGVRNHLDSSVVVDAVAVRRGFGLEVLEVEQASVVPPRGTVRLTLTGPLSSGFTGGVSGVVKPGSIYRVSSAGLQLISSGTYFEYNGTIPVNNPPPNYKPNIKGVSTNRTLTSSGSVISANLRGGEFAATRLTTDNVQTQQLFILAQVEPLQWLSRSDVVFFLDFNPGALVILLRADNRTYVEPGGSAPSNRYIAINSTQTNLLLFLGDSTQPVITAPPATATSASLYAGLARVNMSERRQLGFVVYLPWGESKYTATVLNYGNYLYYFYDTQYSGTSRSGTARTFSNVNTIRVVPGQNGTTPVFVVHNPTWGQSDWEFTVEIVHSSGSVEYFRFFVPRLNATGVVSDILILWDIMANPFTGAPGWRWVDTVVRLTRFLDNTVRLAFFLIMWNTVDYYYYVNVESARATPSQIEVNGTLIYSCGSPSAGGRCYYYNEVIRNGVRYYTEIPELVFSGAMANVSTRVPYLAAFTRSRVGLLNVPAGSTVTFITPGRSVSFTSAGGTLTVDLLSLFGPRELIEALKQWGGVRVLVQSSPDASKLEVPGEVLVHVAGRGVDVWVPSSASLVSLCYLSARTSSTGTLTLTRMSRYITTQVSNSTGSSITLGTFMRIEGQIASFQTITVNFTNGTTRVYGPGSVINGVRLEAPLYILAYGDRVYIATSYGVIELRNYRELSVRGSFEVRGYFTG
ncbi:MAG: hypothetical protein QXM08_00935 [Thermofilaceae archaeon]